MADREVLGLLPAAGRATRLGIDGPKELLVHRGRPVIDHSVEHLVRSGVRTIVVVTRPGKEAVAEHLRSAWPAVRFVEVRQPEPIGALLDAIRCAVPALGEHDVRLLFPDTHLEARDLFGTRVAPRPRRRLALRDGRRARAGGGGASPELVLLCHDAAAGDAWRHYGVVDVAGRRVVEKPAEPLGSTWCWGAAWWAPSFTARLATAATLTDAINAARWHAERTIDRYEDIGLRPGLTVP